MTDKYLLIRYENADARASRIVDPIIDGKDDISIIAQGTYEQMEELLRKHSALRHKEYDYIQSKYSDPQNIKENRLYFEGHGSWGDIIVYYQICGDLSNIRR
jgi:hypothetical protein